MKLVGSLSQLIYARKTPQSTFFKEPTFLTGIGGLNPDLGIKKENSVFVDDYTVCYEIGDSLRDAAEE